MTGELAARFKRKIERWLWARQEVLPRRDDYRYLALAVGVYDSARDRVLTNEDVLELPGLDLWEERIA